MDFGNDITLSTDTWRFSDVVDEFDKHILQSVPHCQEQREFIAGLARFFLYEGATCYEIGVSTGALAQTVLARLPQRPCRYIGLDVVPNMVALANRKLGPDSRFEAVVADALTFPLDHAALVLSYYTLQFIPLADRIELVQRIQHSLQPGGALILYEKTLGGDAQVQDILTQMYFDFKARQGFEPAAIINKASALQGVAMPISFEANRSMLLEAGFNTVEVVYRAYAFAGFLAIKDKI
jgi:tRNA (cmo5U34)-methyltransferase